MKTNTKNQLYINHKEYKITLFPFQLQQSKNGKEEIAEYSISKMYKKISSSEYELQILLKDEDGTYVFYASEDGSKHSTAELWWNLISD